MKRCNGFWMLLSLLGGLALPFPALADLINIGPTGTASGSPSINNDFLPALANDGDNTEDTFYHSTGVASPFWKVEFGSDFLIEQIDLYNRADGGGSFGNRFHNVQVFIRNANNDVLWTSPIVNPWDGTGTPPNPDPGLGNNGPHSVIVDGGGILGENVLVRKVFDDGGTPIGNASSPWLPLAEVEVFVDAAGLTNLTVDRVTGAMTLNHTAGAPGGLDLLGYSITSDLGALDDSGWKSVADNYDSNSGGGFDNDDIWTKLSSGSGTDLSEFQFTGSSFDGGTLSPGQSLVLSEGSNGAGGAWIGSSLENDLAIELQLLDGSTLNVPVVYTGNGDEPLSRSDFDANGIIEAADYLALLGSLSSPAGFAANGALAHQMGDTDYDGDVDIIDFENFRADYEAVPSNGSFADLVRSVAVPEPSTGAALVLGALGLVSFRKRRGWSVIAVVMFGVALGVSSPSQADTLGWWRLGDDDTTPAPVDGAAVSGSINSPTAGGTMGDLTSGTAVPTYSNLVPGQTIIDPLDLSNDGGKYLNDWSIAGQRDTVAEQRLGSSASSSVPSGAFTFESFVRYGDTSVSRGVDFARHISTGQGGWSLELHTATSGSSNFESVLATLQSSDGEGLVNLQLVSTSKLVDNTWHHIALVYEGNSQDGSDDAHLFIDGQLEASGNVPDANAFGATNTSLFVGEAAADAIINVDEARYLDSSLALDGTEFLRVGTLKATVNTGSGEIKLVNDTLQTIDLSSYEISSPLGMLLQGDADWISLSDQNRNPVNGGLGTGETWDEGLSSGASSLSEVFWLGSTVMSPGEEISLGNAYDTGAIDNDLAVLYHDRELGKTIVGVVEYIGTTTNLPGDFDDDGVVDAIDYAVWRENLGGDSAALNGNGSGGATVGSADYALWRSSYGSTSGAPSAGPNAAPEPGAFALVALVVAGCLAMRRRASLVSVRVIAPVACIAMLAATDAQADVTIDRLYSMGDYADGPHFEGQSALNGPAGTDATTTFDSAAVDEFLDGIFADLDEIPTIDLPVYYQLTAGDPGDTGTFALSFDGDDAIFTDKTMDSVGLSAATAKSQGMQFWAKPSLAGLQAGERQSLVMDTNNFGGAAIAADGTWTMTSGNQTNIAGVAPVAADAWAHVAMHAFLPGDAANPGGGGDYTTVMYVNGAAVAVNADTNVGTPAGDFTVGGDNISGTVENFYHGVIDDLSAYTSEADGFNLLEDNTYIADFIDDSYVAAGKSTGTPYEPGDINLDGDVDTEDVTAFVAGWLDENQLVGAFDTLFVGDLNTLQSGDLNLDGQVNLTDAFLLHEALAPSGGLDFSLLSGSQAPEPGSAMLLALATLATAGRRRFVR